MNKLELTLTPRCAAYVVPVCRFRETATTLSLSNGIRLRYCKQLEDIAHAWEALAPADNVFLQLPFLRAVEQAQLPEMRFAYAVVEQAGTPKGLLYFQRLPLCLADALPDQERSFLKRAAITAINEDLLMCGNVLLTGAHGLHFTDDTFSPCMKLQIAQEALTALSKDWIIQYQKPSLLILKDVWKQHERKGCKFRWHEYLVEPGMRINIRSHWDQFSDYLIDMTSKYRVRAKRAAKSASDIIRRPIEENELTRLLPRLYSLYQQIVSDVDFNLLVVPPTFFQAMQHYLGSGYEFMGYFHKERPDEPIGFYTLIENTDGQEAHYLGFDQQLNRKYALYHNMLYDMIKSSIAQGSSSLHLARTALEIKSSVGAEPEQHYSYARHNQPVHHVLLPHIFKRFFNAPEWQQRHPFKDS